MPDAPWGVVRVDFSRPPKVTVMLWGYDNLVVTPIAGRSEMVYRSQESLPEWMQRKLAVLMGIDYESINEAVPEVGRRVSKHIYWVYRSLGENLETATAETRNGTNTRKKSKGPRPQDA